MRNRSMAFKLTAAFVFVGIVSIALVAFFVAWQTSREFDRFVVDRFGADLAGELGRYYGGHGSLDGVATLFADDVRPGVPRIAPFVVVDTRGNVLFGTPWTEPMPDPARDRRAVAIRPGADSKAAPVGYILFDLPRPGSTLPATPEQRFIARMRTAALLGALGAFGLALLLGGLIARSLTRPLAALTEATHALAQGEWGRRVPVNSRDELGQLGLAFNQMSSDLERSMRLRRQLTADIAHDLRTPLSVILGYAEALDEGKFQPSQEVFSVLHDEALHLNHLIDDLRLLSLADAGELGLRKTPTDPNDLTARTASAFRLGAEQRGIVLTVEATPGLPVVQVDVERMAQVMGNLLGNAIRHTPAGGTITLRARAGEVAGTVALDVADTGEGIAPEELESIFDRFYRGDKARRQTGESGLGLAIARSIVEAHGGTLTVTSQPGAGSMFAITLPAG